LRADRDGLAQVINIPVAVPGKGPGGQLDDVSIDDGINGQLSRGIVSRSIRRDKVGSGRNGHGENCAKNSMVVQRVMSGPLSNLDCRLSNMVCGHLPLL
jgi:hypothetical protein